jgi:hypothetical protein
MTTNNGTGQFIWLYWEETSSELESLPAGAQGAIRPGILCVPPPVGDLLTIDGFWDDANRELGTMLDQFEEESLRPEHARRLGELMSQRESEYRKSPAGEVLRRTVAGGVAPMQSIVLVEITVGDVTRWMKEIAAFLAVAAQAGKVVVLSL